MDTFAYLLYIKEKRAREAAEIRKIKMRPSCSRIWWRCLMPTERPLLKDIARDWRTATT